MTSRTSTIQITDSIVLRDNEIIEHFIRARGPGGQNLNKTATAVELRVDIPASSLPQDTKARLIVLAGKHVTNDGVLVVASRALRSQLQNREAARARLVGLLKRAANPPKERKPTRISRAVRKERLIAKERHSDVKRARSGRDED